MVGDDARRDVEIGVEQRDQIGRFGALGHAGEALDVGEQRGDLAHLAAQAQRRRDRRRCGAPPRAPGAARSSGAAAVRATRRARSAPASPRRRRARAMNGGPAGSISSRRRHRRDRGGGPGQADQHRERRCRSGPQPRRQQQTEQAKQRGAGRFRDVGPGRADRHIAAQDRLDRLGLDQHRWRRRRAGVTRSPPNSGALLPISTIRPGERGPRPGFVDQPSPPGSCGAAGQPQQAQRRIAAKRHGQSPTMQNAVADRSAARRPPARAGPSRRPGRAAPRRPPSPAAAPGGSGHRHRPPATRAPKPCAASASTGIGPMTPLARHRPGSDDRRAQQDRRGRQVLTGIRRYPARSRAQTVRPTAACASAASPSAENRSGPASRMSSAERRRLAGRHGGHQVGQRVCAATARCRTAPAPRGRYRR